MTTSELRDERSAILIALDGLHAMAINAGQQLQGSINSASPISGILASQAVAGVTSAIETLLGTLRDDNA